MDEVTRLVENLQSGKLGLTHIQIAIRTYIRQRNDIPDGIKDLLGGKGDSHSGLIYHQFTPIQEVIGAMEIAYRRGVQKGKEHEKGGS